MAASSFRVRSRAVRALTLALPFAVAACGDDTPTGTGGDLNATSLGAASTQVDAALDAPVLHFLIQGSGSAALGTTVFERSAVAPARAAAAASLLTTRGGTGTQATLATAALESGVRAQISRAVAASGTPLYDASMYGATFVATPDSVYRDADATGAPADGFAVVLVDAADATVGTIEVRDSSTASVAKQGVTILTAGGVAVAQYTESLSGTVPGTGASELNAQMQGTIGLESKLTFSRSFSYAEDATGAGTAVFAGSYTLPGGAHAGVELRLVDPAQDATSSLTLTYGRSTFKVEVPSVPDASSTSGWAPSDTTRIIADGRLIAIVVETRSQDGMVIESQLLAPDGTNLQAADMLVIQRAQELTVKLLQVDFVLGAVEEFVSHVVGYVQLIP